MADEFETELDSSPAVTSARNALMGVGSQPKPPSSSSAPSIIPSGVDVASMPTIPQTNRQDGNPFNPATLTPALRTQFDNLMGIAQSVVRRAQNGTLGLAGNLTSAASQAQEGPILPLSGAGSSLSPVQQVGTGAGTSLVGAAQNAAAMSKANDLAAFNDIRGQYGMEPLKEIPAVADGAPKMGRTATALGVYTPAQPSVSYSSFQGGGAVPSVDVDGVSLSLGGVDLNDDAAVGNAVKAFRDEMKWLRENGYTVEPKF